MVATMLLRLLVLGDHVPLEGPLPTVGLLALIAGKWLGFVTWLFLLDLFDTMNLCVFVHDTSVLEDLATCFTQVFPWLLLWTIHMCLLDMTV